MNKFEELAQQAGLIVDDIKFSKSKLSYEDLQFAKLIVQNCAKVADLADENGCESIGGNILTYFACNE